MTSPLTADTPLLPLALRDTALTVTSLARGGTPDSFAAFRQRCKAQVDKLRDELRASGHPDDVIDDASYAQCALLDESALSHLQDGDRDQWEREPLQVLEFNTHDAGEELIARIKRRLDQPQPIPSLLAIFHAVLALGFKGRFARDGGEARMSLMTALASRLGSTEESSGPVVVRPETTRRWLGHISLPGWIVCACVAACVVYFALDRWLAAAIAQLSH
jgi:type VI secretion system protein ImpK